MTVTWLTTLPAPQARGLKITQPKTGNSIEFDAGNRRAINRASNAPRLIECQFLMTAAQLASFDGFFKNDLAYGTAWITASWLDVLGFGLYVCRFLEPPKPQKQGGMYALSCQFIAVVSVTVFVGSETGFYLGDENNNYVMG